MVGAVAKEEAYTLAGAFLLGAVVATVAVLRIVKAITNFFAGVDRQRRRFPDED
jgi:hypothetical protein